MSPEQGEKLRELYRKNFEALILLPELFPELLTTTGTEQRTEARNNNVHRTSLD